MAMNGATWRSHPFVVGERYIALTDNPDFTEGEVASGSQYQLDHIGHSHYDGASIFIFTCLATKEKVSWWWFDHAPDAACDEYFQPVSS